MFAQLSINRAVSDRGLITGVSICPFHQRQVYDIPFLISIDKSPFNRTRFIADRAGLYRESTRGFRTISTIIQNESVDPWIFYRERALMPRNIRWRITLWIHSRLLWRIVDPIERRVLFPWILYNTHRALPRTNDPTFLPFTSGKPLCLTTNCFNPSVTSICLPKSLSNIRSLVI